MASNLLLNGLTQTLLSFVNIMFPIYCNSVLNSWNFFGDILRPFLSQAFNKSSHFAICALFKGVKSNKSSLIASQCFLLCRHSKITFIYDCQNMVIYCSIFLNLLKALMNEIHPLNLLLKDLCT